MQFTYKVYVKFRFMLEVIIESTINSWRWTPFGPKKLKNYPKDLKGKVVLITGSNAGIGKVTARVMAELGAKVIMACRDIPKSQIAVNEIKQQVKEADIELKRLDLSSLASVRQCAKEINQTVDKIDILINNAGVMWCPKWLTEDGFEMQFGTNHLGHFLFTLLLMDKLKNSTKARIVNVASVAHILGEINFQDINYDKNYDKYEAYSQSKLANVLFSRELANRLTDTDIKVYCLHPGLIRSDLYRHAKGLVGSLLSFSSRLFHIDVELGAQTTLYCALDESIGDETGHYYKNCGRVNNMVSNATDDNSARRLWKLSCELVDIEEKYKL